MIVVKSDRYDVGLGGKEVEVKGDNATEDRGGEGRGKL